MSIQEICDLLKTHKHENTREAFSMAEKLEECSSSEVDMLLNCLNTEKEWEIRVVLTALKRAKTDHARILMAVKPLLWYQNLSVIECAFELCDQFGEQANELAPAVIDSTDMLIEAMKVSRFAIATVCAALRLLSKMAADSKSVMRMARKLNWSLPREFDSEFYSNLPEAGLIAIGRHWEGDVEFAEKTILSQVNSKSYTNVSMAAYSAMLRMAPRRPAMMRSFIDALRLFSPTKEKYLEVGDLLDLLLQSELHHGIIVDILLDPDVLYAPQSNNDRPRGYRLIRSKEVFPMCRSTLEVALTGTDFERFQRAALYFLYAGPLWPEVMTILINEARRCDQHKLGLLLDVLLQLHAPADELRLLFKRATDNNWTTRALDDVALRIHQLTT